MELRRARPSFAPKELRRTRPAFAEASEGTAIFHLLPDASGGFRGRFFGARGLGTQRARRRAGFFESLEERSAVSDLRSAAGVGWGCSIEREADGTLQRDSTYAKASTFAPSELRRTSRRTRSAPPPAFKPADARADGWGVGWTLVGRKLRHSAVQQNAATLRAIPGPELEKENEKEERERLDLHPNRWRSGRSPLCHIAGLARRASCRSGGREMRKI